MLLLIRDFKAQRMHEPAFSRRKSLTLASPSHDVDGKDAALMRCEQVINEIADDRIRFVSELRHDAADQRVAPAMPFQIDRAMEIVRAMDLRPAVRAPRLFRPGFDEAEFLFQLWIASDLAAQRSASARDHLDDGLHL